MILMFSPSKELYVVGSGWFWLALVGSGWFLVGSGWCSVASGLFLSVHLKGEGDPITGNYRFSVNLQDRGDPSGWFWLVLVGFWLILIGCWLALVGSG